MPSPTKASTTPSSNTKLSPNFLRISWGVPSLPVSLSTALVPPPLNWKMRLGSPPPPYELLSRPDHTTAGQGYQKLMRRARNQLVHYTLHESTLMSIICVCTGSTSCEVVSQPQLPPTATQLGMSKSEAVTNWKPIRSLPNNLGSHFPRVTMSLLGASCNQDVSSYPSPEPGTGYAAKTALIIAKNSAGSGLFRWPAGGRCSAEALVTPRTLPCQGLIDVSGGVRVSEAASPSRRLACADTRSCQLIREPWGTPQRATPKSCCPCQKKNLKNSQKFKNISKNNWQKQSTHSKTNSKK